MGQHDGENTSHDELSGKTLYYLKKKVMLARQGIVIQPNPSYIKKMVELLELEGKSFPHHSSLEVYNKDEIKDNERLDAEGQQIFSSGLELALYIAQDQPDIHTFNLHSRWNKISLHSTATPSKLLNDAQESGVLLMQTKM